MEHFIGYTPPEGPLICRWEYNFMGYMPLWTGSWTFALEKKSSGVILYDRQPFELDVDLISSGVNVIAKHQFELDKILLWE